MLGTLLRTALGLDDGAGLSIGRLFEGGALSCLSDTQLYHCMLATIFKPAREDSVPESRGCDIPHGSLGSGALPVNVQDDHAR